MQRRILLSVIIALAFISFLNPGCSKLDTTSIGSDLLPPVDNVKTFDTTLIVNTTQGIFNDTTIVNKFSDHALGVITNDPLFGKTNADIFMQLKPSFYPFYLGNPRDTLIQLDSVILCLKYKGFWGDSTLPINLQVREVVDVKFRDSVYKERNINMAPTTGALLATASVDVRKMENYIKFTNGRDSVNNQIRIKMPNAWAAQLYARDSVKANAGNNAFYTDSAFRSLYHGLAVIATGASNGLMYINLSDTGTKLEVHFKRRNNNKLDSVYTSLVLNTNGSPSSTAPPPSSTVNHIVRDRSGKPVLNPSSQEIYLQASSGTYAKLNIPGIAGLSNRVIHRAEIIIEQIPTPGGLDDKMTVPNFLYLDLRDTGLVEKWKPIYYDLNPAMAYDPDYSTGINYFPNPVDYQYFGGYRRDKIHPVGGAIKYYTFNITRHIQQIVTKRTTNYDFRVYAPFNFIYPQYSGSYISYPNNIAYGRVKVGSGTNPNYKMRLRIIYSKL